MHSYPLCFQHPDDNISPAQEAVLHIQSRVVDLGPDQDGVITTRLLVPSNQIGCLLGKGGSIIADMRRHTRANIRILAKNSLPRCASETDELVQVMSFLHTVIFVLCPHVLPAVISEMCDTMSEKSI